MELTHRFYADSIQVLYRFYAVMTLIFPTSQRKCARSSKNIAILLLWSKRAITAPQQTDRQSALQTEKNNRMPFTHTFNRHNNPVKTIILNNFKIVQNHPETARIFSQPPLVSFKRDSNIVRNALLKRSRLTPLVRK